MTAKRDVELSPTLNLLATLIGEFAYPNPDDGEPHGPGAPHIRGELAAIRRVTISVAQWAEHLGEQSMGSLTESEYLSAMEEDQASPKPDKPRSTNAKAAPTRGGDNKSQDGGGADTNSVKGTEPPTVARAIICKAIHKVVSDFSGNRPVSLPVPASPDANPWTLFVSPGRTHSLGMLVAGAQFQFAAAATSLTGLRMIFQRAARDLITTGLDRLGQDTRGLRLSEI